MALARQRRGRRRRRARRELDPCRAPVILIGRAFPSGAWRVVRPLPDGRFYLRHFGSLDDAARFAATRPDDLPDYPTKKSQ